jgi:hypothetical protein
MKQSGTVINLNIVNQGYVANYKLYSTEIELARSRSRYIVLEDASDVLEISMDWLDCA